MPVILEKEDIDPWLKDISRTKEILSKPGIVLQKSSYKNHFSKGDLMNITEFQKSRFGLLSIGESIPFLHEVNGSEATKK